MKFKTNKGVAIAKQLLTKLGSKSKTMAVVAALFASANVSAQTPKTYPAYFKGHDINEILTATNADDKQVYLYNVGLKKFIMPGGAWGTSLDLGDTGLSFYVIKDGNLPADPDGYRFYSKGVQTEIGSSLAMTPSGKIYTDRLLIARAQYEHPRIRLTKVAGTDANTHMYYISGYQGGSLVAKTGADKTGTSADTTWTYSNERYAVASKTPLDYNTSVDYEPDFNKVKAMADSLSLWKIVTLKDLKGMIKDMYRANEEPANVSYVMKDPWVMRSTIRHKNWDITPQNALFNDVSTTYGDRNGPLAHAEFQGKTGTMSQTVTVHNPGWYVISCKGFAYKSGNSGITAKLFAKDNNGTKTYASKSAELYSVTDISNMGNYLARGRKFIEGEYANNNVMIYVDGDKNNKNFSTTITLGVEVTGNNVQSGDIVAFDDFKIQYSGVNMIVLDEDRSDREYIEKQVDATTARTLVMQRAFKENQWNSIIFPFDLTGDQVEKAFGSNAKVSKFKGPSAVKETLIEFESVALGAANKHNKVIEAGKLYLIYPAKTLENATEEKVFTVISPTTGKQEISVTGTYFTIPNVNLDTAPSADNIEEPYKHSTFGATSLRYRGTYVNHTNAIIPANSFVLNKDGYWYRTSKAHTVKGFRCWIEPINPTASAIKRLNISIDGVILNGTSDTLTGIEELELSNDANKNSNIYDAYGRVIGNTAEGLSKDFKGVYIINGKKYVK
jgi:SO34 adhesin